jgi:hypothetical protein
MVHILKKVIIMNLLLPMYTSLMVQILQTMN